MTSQNEAYTVGTAPAIQLRRPDESSDNEPREFNSQTNYMPQRKVIMVFLACASVDLVALMDQTTLAASVSIISRALEASSQIAWVSAAYFITSTSAQLLYGRLSDVWSRKAILLACMAIFFMGSLAASLSQTAAQLIVFRAFTGIGGGGLMTVAQTIGAVVGLANGIGPIIGALLASRSRNSWRWIFRLNLPLAIISSLSVVFFMPLKKVHGHWITKIRAIDFFGAFLALGGSTLLVLALTWAGGDYPWSSAAVIATLIVGIIVCVGFILWQWKGTSKPLIPLRIFNSGIVNGACITMSVNGWNFLVQESLIIGWIVWAIGLGLFSTLDETSGLGKQVGYAMLTGFGVGQTLQPSLIAIQAGVSREDMAVVTGTRNFVRNLGGTLGLAVAGTIINNSIKSILTDFGLPRSRLQELLNQPTEFIDSNFDREEAERIRASLIIAYRKGFRIVFILGAVLAAVSTLLVIFLMPQLDLDRPDDEKLKQEGKEMMSGRAEKRENDES